MVLSNEEKDHISAEVNNFPYDDLLVIRKDFIFQAENVSSSICRLIDTTLNTNSQEFHELENKLFVLIEYLVFIDGRIENKSNWFFRSTRRIKWANKFRYDKQP